MQNDVVNEFSIHYQQLCIDSGRLHSQGHIKEEPQEERFKRLVPSTLRF